MTYMKQILGVLPIKLCLSIILVIMSQPRVCIIIPAINEEATIGQVIDEIPRQALQQDGYLVDILLVDGNSTDRTRQVAQEKGAEIIIEPRKGKGRAVRIGLESVTSDFIFILDADYTYPPTYIPAMLNILQHGYDVVIGSRLTGKRERGSISRLNMVGNRLLTLMANILYQTRISDLCTGYWGIKGKITKDLKLKANGFDFEAELFTHIAKRGYSIGEVPIYYRRRQTPPKLSSLRDGIKIAWKLITERF